MKKILILSPYQFDYCPYHEWFKNKDCQLFLIGSCKAVDTKVTTPIPAILEQYQEYYFFDDFDNNNQVVVKAIEIIETAKITHIICLNEMGLERAAHLREMFQLPGQSVESARAYRNKRIMKQHLQNVVPLADWRYGYSSAELMRSIREIDFPCVYKHVNGAGSVGTIVLKDEAALRTLLTTYKEGSEFLIEGFVPGDMFTVDGYFHEGEIYHFTASRLINTCLSYQEAKPLGSQTLLPEDPLLARFKAHLRQIIHALPETKTMPYHAEFWLQEDGRIVLCEIASRMGGAGIREVYQESLGVDPMELHALAQACFPLDLSGENLPDKGVWGYLLMPPKNGKLLNVPHYCPIEGVRKYMIQLEQGSVCYGAQSSVSCVQKFIINSNDIDAFHHDITLIEDWSNQTLLWATVS